MSDMGGIRFEPVSPGCVRVNDPPPESFFASLTNRILRMFLLAFS